MYHRPSYKLPDAGRPKLSLSTSARTQPCCKASSTRLQTLLNFFLCFSLSVLFSFVFPSFLLYFYFTSQTSSDRLRVPLASSLNKLYKKKKKKFPPFFPPSFLTQKKKKKTICSSTCLRNKRILGGLAGRSAAKLSTHYYEPQLSPGRHWLMLITEKKEIRKKNSLNNVND